jgi:hypothetical protein
MDRFTALGRGMQLMLVGSVLLFIDLFLPWQAYTGPFEEEIEALGGDTSFTAFHGFGGWLLALLTLGLIAWIVARMAAVEIPIPVSAAMTAGVVAFFIFAVALLKNLIDDYSAWGSYVGVVLAAIIAVGAWMEIQQAGGLEHVKSQIPGSVGGAATASAPAAPAGGAPAPAEPAAPAAPPETAPAAPVEPAASDEAAESESSPGDEESRT